MAKWASDMNKWADEKQGTLALFRTVIGFANLLFASLITLRVFGVIWVDGILEIVSILSFLFMVALYVQIWVMRKQMDRVDLIVYQFYNMFSNAYQIISEEELNHIMKRNMSDNDNSDEIKEWDEGY